MSSKMGVNISLYLSHSFVCGQSFLLRYDILNIFVSRRVCDRRFSTFPEMSSLGNRARVTIFMPCGNWALCSQMSVSVSVRVFSSFPQDKVRADQFSSVAATLAPCHCRPPGPGWLGWSRRPQKTGTFYSFFMDLTLVRLPRCSGPPLSVTQPRPRP